MPWAPISRSSETDADAALGERAVSADAPVRKMAGIHQFFLSSDQIQLSTTGGSRDHQEPIDHRRRVRECSRHILPSSVARKVAAVTSPLPVKV